MRDTNTVAALTEGRVLAAFVANGYTVAVPFGVARYDLVLDTKRGLKRVQCKTGRLRSGAVRFRVYSVNRLPDGRYGKTGYQGDADLFGVFCPENDQVYLVPVDNTRQEISLRVEPARSNQVAGTRRAADYEVQHAGVAQW